MTESAMFNYTKEVIKKVWFNDQLFEKQYEKAKRRLTQGEMRKLDEFIETLKQ